MSEPLLNAQNSKCSNVPQEAAMAIYGLQRPDCARRIGRAIGLSTTLNSQRSGLGRSGRVAWPAALSRLTAGPPAGATRWR
jgi:hypothetical protein